jgi:predicted nucleic acid-binding protein
MSAPEIIWIDSDVLLDHLLRRDPWNEAATELLVRGAAGQIDLRSSALVFANVHYILRKLVGKPAALRDIQRLAAFIGIANMGQVEVTRAFDSGMSDFEDALQIATAIRVPNLSAILTRNLGDYAQAGVPAMTPRDWLASRPAVGSSDGS